MPEASRALKVDGQQVGLLLKVAGVAGGLEKIVSITSLIIGQDLFSSSHNGVIFLWHLIFSC